MEDEIEKAQSFETQQDYKIKLSLLISGGDNDHRKLKIYFKRYNGF